MERSLEMEKRSTVLLVVDVQRALVEGHPFREREWLELLKGVVGKAREQGVEVVYVRHDGGSGDELAYGAEGWQIYGEVGPLAGERVFDKRFNSAFKDTGLDEWLREKGIRSIVLVGMQTEYCIDATCKGAFERGYEVVIPEGGTTTFNNEVLGARTLVDYFERKMWNGRYAAVKTAEEVWKDL